MNKSKIIATKVVAFVLASGSFFAAAHEEIALSAMKIEKAYATSGALGKINIVYSGRNDKGNERELLFKCDLYSNSVPAVGLDDLPQPDWSGFAVTYASTSYGPNGKAEDRPYACVTVRLLGPQGENWPDTWVIFTFDADGKLNRSIKRFKKADPATNSIQVIWKDWPIGSGISANDMLTKVRNP